ncbi:MAG TPA: HAD family phosphatase [archaeon]|nr:HAD family phosphatase [archaeon]
MLEAVIFDFDGVLVDTPSYYFKHMREYLEKLNTDITDEDVSNLVGMTFAKKLAYINEKYKLNVQREPFVRDTSAAMMAEMEKSLLLDEHLDMLLRSLKKSKIRMAIASNNSRPNIDFFLKKLEIAHYFSNIISYEDVTEHKPNPETYLKAVQTIRARASNCIAIEDTAIGLDSAKGAGLKCIAIPNKFTSLQDFRSADLVIKNFTEINPAKLKSMVAK